MTREEIVNLKYGDYVFVRGRLPVRVLGADSFAVYTEIGRLQPDCLERVTLPTVYLSGPMAGIPDFNFPLFNKVAAELRSLSLPVENPAENPKPEGVSEDGLWVAYMRMAITQMMKCDVIVFLPGYEKSSGAMVEHDLGRVLNMRKVEYGTPSFTVWVEEVRSATT